MDHSDQKLNLLSNSIDKIRAIKATNKDDPKQAINQLLDSVREISEIIGGEIQDVIHNFEGYKCKNLEEKRALANGFNALLSACGLSIKCPKSGRPSRLITRIGAAAPNGHFQIEHRGSPRHVALSSVTFPYVELIPSEADGRIHYKDGHYTGRI